MVNALRQAAGMFVFSAHPLFLEINFIVASNHQILGTL
jgi:hypothetical protein